MKLLCEVAVNLGDWGLLDYSTCSRWGMSYDCVTTGVKLEVFWGPLIVYLKMDAIMVTLSSEMYL